MNDERALTRMKQALCLTCLKCCKIIAFPTIYNPSREVTQFYEMRGWKTHYDKQRDILFIYGEQVCPHLTDKGCDIYLSRPAACVQYDGRHDGILHDECAWNKLSHVVKI